MRKQLVPNPASTKDNQEENRTLTIDDDDLPLLIGKKVQVLVYENKPAQEVLVLRLNQRSELGDPLVREA